MSLENSKDINNGGTEEFHISVQKTFRYVVHGDKQKAKYILYVLHGYGQLARFFIRKFSFLSNDYFVVAPEGMHRFYLNGHSGRVGASWMTKEDRESDIADNLNYLDQLQLIVEEGHQFEKKIVLGFSQGGATAARWYFNSRFKADQLILWATVFPPDLDIKKETVKENDQNNYFVIGNSDEFYSHEDQNRILKFYEINGFRTLTFNGKHDIDQKTLKTILSEITPFRI